MSNCCDLFFYFLLLYIMYSLLRYKNSHPPSPLHTRRLKSQHHEIITTFPNSTPHYGFALGVECISPHLLLPLGLSLWAFFTLG